MIPEVKAFFDQATHTVSYVVSDPGTGRCAIVDPVLDCDWRAGRISTASADAVIGFVESRGLGLDWIVETHLHADHLTAAPRIKDRLGGAIAIGARVVEVQSTFAALFNAGPEFVADGGQFDRLFGDGERFDVGAIEGEVMHTPGHTPACACYRIGDALFVGDTLFMPDSGTARTDFPGGSARTLFASLGRILALPGDTRLFVCHDYGADGKRAYAWETTVGEQRAGNIHLGEGVGEDQFVAMREGRDATLAMPNLILPAVQVNMRAGQLPPPEDNGTVYLKIPLNAL